MTIEQYLLIKNTLNIQLGIAWQKFILFWTNKSEELQEDLRKSGIFGENSIYNLSTPAFQIKWLEESLILLDKCYEEGDDFEKTIKKIHKDKIGISLLPQKGNHKR